MVQILGDDGVCIDICCLPLFIKGSFSPFHKTAHPYFSLTAPTPHDPFPLYICKWGQPSAITIARHLSTYTIFRVERFQTALRAQSLLSTGVSVASGAAGKANAELARQKRTAQAQMAKRNFGLITRY